MAYAAHAPASRSAGFGSPANWPAATSTKDVYALYEPPAPTGMTDNPDLRAAGRAEVVEVDDPTLPTEVVIVERTGHDGNEFHQLPFALTPGPPLKTTTLRNPSIDRRCPRRRICRNYPTPRCSTSCCAARRAPAAARPCPAAPTSPPPSPQRHSTWIRRTWRCTDRREPARRTPPPG